jgi:deoxycytidylate deaminase
MTIERNVLSVDPDATDIFIGLVGGIGANFKAAVQHIADHLVNVYSFEVHHVRLASLLRQFKRYENLDRNNYPGSLENYYKDAIQGGNHVRETLKNGAALARLAMADIQEKRKASGKRRAFIIDSLKRPEEVAEFRQVYGLLFYCVAIYADATLRERRLTEEFSESISSSENSATKRLEAARLVARDNGENLKYGQAVRKTFQEADYFVRTDEGSEFGDALRRIVDLALDKPFISPTRSEVAMMHAFAAGLRSADLSRQVGAAIVSRDGRILTTGSNEVPAPGGGQYWEDDPDDARDFVRGRDENDRLKERAVLELLQVLSSYAFLNPSRELRGLPSIYAELEEKGALADTRLDSLIER